MGSRCVKLGVIALTLSYWSLEVQHGTPWQITLPGSEKRFVVLHKDGVGYKGGGGGGQPVSAQTICRTLHQIGLHDFRPRRKPLLNIKHKKAQNIWLKTSRLRTWITGTMLVMWSDETKINLFGSGEQYKDKCAKPSVKHSGGSVMVRGCMSAADMYCDILKQSIIPSVQRLHPQTEGGEAQGL